MTEHCKLYAFTHSLYSGRARSYLIKSGIPFKELSTGHESFKSEVLPKGKLPTIPTLVTPEGEVIRDGGNIIEHFEAARGRPFQPLTPRQQVVSALFALIGTDGLLRPAMHYRWNFLEQNEQFSHYHFLHSQRHTETREEKTRYMMGKMQNAAQLWGVNEKTIPLVESLYREYLDALNNHLETVPYLLGWKPSIGDFGLLAPMYAHLGRDPVPANLMKQNAIRVFRWVERMNSPQSFVVKPSDGDPQLFADDGIPCTLKAMMAFIAEEYLPELIAHTTFANDWLSQQTDLKAGTNGLDDPGRRFIGRTEFEWRGITLKTTVMPYRFYLLQRLQDSVVSASEHEQQVIRALFEETGLIEMLDLRTHRRVERVNHLEVWGSES